MHVVISIISILLVLSLLALVHEFGHFIAARIFKVNVVEFSVFIGPKLFQVKSKRSGTKYTLRLLPLGGYCAFDDDVRDENGNPIESDNKLNDQVWWKRAIIFSAGVFMNVVVALIIATVMTAVTGFQSSKIEYVDPASVANFAGIEKGDELIKMNGFGVLNYTDEAIAELSIKDIDDAEDKMHTHYTLVYKKADGSKVKYNVTKKYQFNDDGDVENWSYYIEKKYGAETDIIEYEGIYLDTVISEDGKYLEGYKCNVILKINGKDANIQKEQIVSPYLFGRFGNDNYELIRTKNIFLNIGYGFKEMLSWVKSVYLSLFFMVKGYVGVDAVSGPVGLTSMVNDVISTPQVETGVKMLWVIYVAGLLSANLAVINFLPFPGLDGFYIVLIIVELLRGGKKLPPEKQNLISYIGLGLILLLGVLVMILDIQKIVG